MKLITIIATLLLVVEGQNYKNYCSNKVCNKCRSYLVRNYRDRTDRLWLMCSALARNKNCCQFESGPTLFTLKDPVGFCTNNPDETFTLVGYQLYNLNSSECESSTPELVESDLLVELGVDSVDQVDLDYACVNETSDQSKCTTVASAVKDVEDYENQHGLLFQAENKCQIRMNEYESCAAVMKEKTLSDFKQGAGWVLGVVFCGAFIALIVVTTKYKKRETQRLKLHQEINRRASSRDQDDKALIASPDEPSDFLSYQKETS